MRRKKVLKTPLLNQAYIFWRNPVNWYILMLASAFLSSAWRHLRIVTHATRLPANAFALFSAGFTDSWVLLACAAGGVALLSAVPFVYPAHPQEILRAGQLRYVLLRLFHIALISFLYTIFIFLCTWTLSGSSFKAFHRWGKVMNTIASGNVSVDIGVRMSVPLALTQNYSPLQAAGLAASLFFSVMTSLGWMMYAVSIQAGRRAATLAGALLAVLDLSVDQMGLGYRMYRFSPWSWTRLDLLLDTENPYLIGYSATLVIVLVALFGTFSLALISGLSQRALRQWQNPHSQQE